MYSWTIIPSEFEKKVIVQDEQTIANWDDTISREVSTSC